MKILPMYLICSLGLFFAATASAADNEGNGCAIHFEGDYEFMSKITDMGCTKGYPIMFYNYAATAKWTSILPVRIAALSTCDMSKPITESGVVGSRPYQFVMCTYSGEIRKIKMDKEHSEGWNWENL